MDETENVFCLHCHLSVRWTNAFLLVIRQIASVRSEISNVKSTYRVVFQRHLIKMTVQWWNFSVYPTTLQSYVIFPFRWQTLPRCQLKKIFSLQQHLVHWQILQAVALESLALLVGLAHHYIDGLSGLLDISVKTFILLLLF